MQGGEECLLFGAGHGDLESSRVYVSVFPAIGSSPQIFDVKLECRGQMRLLSMRASIGGPVEAVSLISRYPPKLPGANLRLLLHCAVQIRLCFYLTRLLSLYSSHGRISHPQRLYNDLSSHCCSAIQVATPRSSPTQHDLLSLLLFQKVPQCRHRVLTWCAELVCQITPPESRFKTATVNHAETTPSSAAHLGSSPACQPRRRTVYA